MNFLKKTQNNLNKKNKQLALNSISNRIKLPTYLFKCKNNVSLVTYSFVYENNENSHSSVKLKKIKQC